MPAKLMTAAGGGITLDAASTATDKTITVPADNGTMALTSQLNGFRNRIINGAFQFWQRGTSFTPSSVIFGADRFASYKAGASAGDYARSTDVPSGQGFVYSGYFNNADIRHAVELPLAGNASEYVSGSTWTVSFWAKVGSGTTSNTVGLGFADGTGAGNFGRWGSDQSFTLTTTWQYFTKTFTVSSSPVGSNACVLLYFSAVPSLYITGVQLEKGSVATGFDYRPYGTELALCQRYYQVIASGSGQPIGMGSFIGTTDFRLSYTFPVQMRAAASSVTCSSGASYYRFYWGSGVSATFSGLSLDTTSPQAISFYSGGSLSGVTAGQSGFCLTNNASSFLAVTAEL